MFEPFLGQGLIFAVNLLHGHTRARDQLRRLRGIESIEEIILRC